MAPEQFNVAGKVAVVTGGARGIGFGVAQALAIRGAIPVIIDLDQTAADHAAARLTSNALGLAADVSDRGAIRQAIATTVAERGGVDIVVANAGVASRGATVRAMSTEAFDRVLAVNLGGVYNTVIATLDQIAERRGQIVITSSVYAFINGVGAAPYAIAKAGIEQLGRALRIELAPHGAGATVAYFGYVDTEMVHQAIDADPISQQSRDRVPRPLRKRVSPAQAGEAVARGIERRAPQVIVPKRWTALSMLRGIINPLADDRMVKDPAVRELVRQLDGRADQEQPLTA